VTRRGSKDSTQSDAAWLRSRARTARTSVKNRLAKLKREDPLPSIDDFHTWLTLLERICFYCRVPLDRKNYSIDHCVPLSRGGAVGSYNLQVCCKPCNGSKGSMTDVEYRALRELTSHWPDSGKALFVRLRLGAFNVRRG
jgi:Restriction endonuclease